MEDARGKELLAIYFRKDRIYQIHCFNFMKSLTIEKSLKIYIYKISMKKYELI